MKLLILISLLLIGCASGRSSYESCNDFYNSYMNSYQDNSDLSYRNKIADIESTCRYLNYE
jgi:uncharacterized protein YceK